MKHLHSLFFAAFVLAPLFACSSSGSNTPAPTPPAPAISDADADGVADSEDCAPNDAAISKNVIEIINDGIDQDCTGSDKLVVKKIATNDTNADGIVEQTTTQEYDNAGNMIKSTSESGGVISNITEITYDANKNELSRASDNNGDGSVEYFVTKTYDANNNLLSIISDFNNDGVIDLEEVITYDAFGNKLTFKRYEMGVLKGQNTSTYNADNIITETLYEQFPAGTKQKTKYIYNSDGLQIRSESHQLSGAVFVLKGFSDLTYNAQNLLATISEDNNADGTYERVRYFEYDAEGNQTENNQDGGSGIGVPDGIIDFRGIYLIEDLGDGKFKYTYKTDTGNDGTFEEYEYRVTNQSQEIVYESSRDDDGDGNLDEQYLFTYDAFGEETSMTLDQPFDGTIDYIRNIETIYSE